jgi:hypothetical protein
MGARQEDIDKANEAKEEFMKGCPEGGIAWERSCTDTLCCIIFLAFLVAMLGVSGWAIGTGDPYNIIMPFDSVGNKCGQKDTDFEEYKLKHFTSLLSSQGVAPGMYHAVCVKECPEALTDYNDKCKTNTDIPSCNMATAAYNTQPQMGYCVPTKEDSLEAYNMV